MRLLDEVRHRFLNNTLEASPGLIAPASKAEVAEEHSALDEIHLRIRSDGGSTALPVRTRQHSRRVDQRLLGGASPRSLRSIPRGDQLRGERFLSWTPSEVAHYLGLAVSESISVISCAVRGPSRSGCRAGRAMACHSRLLSPHTPPRVFSCKTHRSSIGVFCRPMRGPPIVKPTSILMTARTASYPEPPLNS